MEKSLKIENGIIIGHTSAELKILMGYVKESIKIVTRQEKKQKPGTNTLFSAQEVDPMTIFRDSALKDFELFEKEITKKGDLGIDLYFYYEAVKNWSDKKPREKRTARGWAATAKDFMRADNQKGKLVMKNAVRNESNPEMLDYLKM